MCTETCVNPNMSCNCDINNEGEQTSDKGYLTIKDHLPIGKMFFGDTLQNGAKGFHTLGEFECF